MVMVAAIALASSTYAWFVNSNKVSATGMSVQATAEGGIEIKAVSSTQKITASTEWSTSADAQMESVTLYPTSTLANAASNGAISTPWYHASADKASAATATGATYAKLETTDGCTFNSGIEPGGGVLSYASTKGAIPEGTYYVATKYQIASIGGTASDLKASGVTVTGTTESGKEEFDKSLRVAVACGSNIALYAPVGYDSAPTYNVCTETAGTPMQLASATNSTTATNVLINTSESRVLSSTVGAENNATDVTVYIWYEGEDSNHYTNNLGTKPDNLKVTVDFAATIN